MKRMILFPFCFFLLPMALGQHNFGKVFQEFSPFGNAAANSTGQNYDGGYVMAGYSGTYPDTIKALFFRTSPVGDTLWTRVVNSASIYSIKPTGSTAFVVCGTNHDPDSTAYLGYLATLDAAGSLTMERFYGSENCCFYEVGVTSDNGYVAAGRSVSPDQKEYPCMVKTDQDGLFTAVPEIWKDTTVPVLPNPTAGLCQARFPPGTIWFGIYNQLGILILSGGSQGSSPVLIHLENQPAGCYLLKAPTMDGMAIQKIIKR